MSQRENSVEVPITWLKKLMELGEKANVKVHHNGISNSWRKDTASLDELKGYIQSAETLLPQPEGTNNE